VPSADAAAVGIGTEPQVPALCDRSGNIPRPFSLPLSCRTPWFRRRRLLAAVAFGCAAASVPAVEPGFRALEIDSKIGIGYGVTVADVDGDRRPDILLVDRAEVAWYQNPTWQKRLLTGKLTPADHVCIAAADLDGDGKAEIAVGAGWNPADTLNSGALFYLDPPPDRTQLWQPVPLPHEPVVHRIAWAKDWQNRWTLVSVPLHGRGNNPQTAEGIGVHINRYLLPTNPRTPWEVQRIDDTLHKTHNFDVVQWDADPAHELLIGAKEGLFLSDRSATGRQPALTPLGTNDLGGVGELRAGSLGATNRFVATIEPMHGHTLAVYQPSRDAAPGALWHRQVLDESLADGHALACGDLLGLGRDQIVVGWRAMNRPLPTRVGVKMFIPSDATGTTWRPYLIDDNTMACEDLQLADLNGDGKLDIVAAGRATHNLKIYFNESP
jgi:hypothetical protein